MPFSTNFNAVKYEKNDFVKPVLNTADLEKALLITKKLVQNKVYGDVICSMQGKSVDALDEVIKQCNVVALPTQKDRLRSLKKYRPCVDGRKRYV